MKQIQLSAAIFGVCAFLSPVQAQPPSADEPTLQVVYSDLDLSRPADQARLKQRIAAAARSICPARERFGRERVLTNDQCFAAAMKASMKRMEIAIAAAKSSKSLASAGRR